MKCREWISVLLLTVVPVVGAEPPVIGSGDMFNTVGLYYRAYANEYDALLNTGSYPVVSLIKSPGADQFWDFSEGPTTHTLRFDYLDPAGLAEAADFPLATLAERKTIEETGELEWLFFEQVPAAGRKVYGFYSEAFSPNMPSIPFSQPGVDFPDTISYLDSWTTTFTGVSLFPSLDPEWMEDFLLQTTWSSAFTADAWGVVLTPNLELVDALRINEEQQIDVAADLGDGWEHIETDYVRSYYWLSPGRGIVAQMTSAAGSSAPPPAFEQAAAFVRMFETNKKPGSGTTDPQPVANLRVTVSNGMVLIQWDKASNATRYRVEYSSGGLAAGDWQVLGEETTGNYLFDPGGIAGEIRFYRVVSLR